MPLRKLLELNLRCANTLKLLDIGGSKIDDFFTLLPAFVGATDKEKITDYEGACRQSWREFADDFRFTCVDRSADIEITRITQLNSVQYALRGTGVFPHGDEEFKAAREELLTILDTKIAQNYASVPKVELSKLTALLDQLRGILISSRPHHTLASAVHGPGSCWISPSELMFNNHLNPRNAQNWRDELGLHHYPMGTTLGNLLVRMTFKAKLTAATLCPTKFDPALRNNHPDAIWLIRPTVADSPNPRFCQASISDSLKSTKTNGRTINIVDAKYDEGLDELVLLHGRDAVLHWVDLELLEGESQSKPWDLEHSPFVDTIEVRHAHLV